MPGFLDVIQFQLDFAIFVVLHLNEVQSVYLMSQNIFAICLKLSLNKKDLDDVTAVPFSSSFSRLPAAKKHTKNGAAVTSLRSFLFCDNFAYIITSVSKNKQTAVMSH